VVARKLTESTNVIPGLRDILVPNLCVVFWVSILALNRRRWVLSTGQLPLNDIERVGHPNIKFIQILK